MEREKLMRLERVNQLRLDDAERERVLAFFSGRDRDLSELERIDTAETERMVHVMPVMTVVREDIERKQFTRDELQRGAPETMDGYWQVPRLVD
jgi:aspartyl-tRNA(Asn)/glutamyl-tRNA(Gln) amidotransferase subunit C